MNRVIQEGIQTGYPRATRLERPRFDPVRPVVVAMILVSVLVLALLILLLSSLKRERRPRRGRLARRLEQLVQQFAGRHLRRHLVGGVPNHFI